MPPLLPITLKHASKPPSAYAAGQRRLPRRPRESEDKRFRCPFCELAYYHKKHLKYHLTKKHGFWHDTAGYQTSQLELHRMFHLDSYSIKYVLHFFQYSYSDTNLNLSNLNNVKSWHEWQYWNTPQRLTVVLFSIWSYSFEWEYQSSRHIFVIADSGVVTNSSF